MKESKGFWPKVEEHSRFWRNFNFAVALGAAALEALVFPGSLFLENVAVFEGLHTVALEGLRRVAKGRHESQPQPA